MYEYAAKVVFVKGFKIGINKLGALLTKDKIDSERISNLAEAIKAIQNASIRTRYHISQKGYTTNTDLSRLWTKAVKKSIVAGIEDIPQRLTQKGRFWGKPQDWLEEKNFMKLIPTLDFLNEQCDMLLVEIANYQKKSNKPKFQIRDAVSPEFEMKVQSK